MQCLTDIEVSDKVPGLPNSERNVGRQRRETQPQIDNYHAVGICDAVLSDGDFGTAKYGRRSQAGVRQVQSNQSQWIVREDHRH